MSTLTKNGYTSCTPELIQETSQEAYSLLCLSEDHLCFQGPSMATRDQSGFSSHSASPKTLLA